MLVMKHLYFIRHGESKANIDGIWGANTHLTDEGVRQAKKAAKHAKEKGLTFNIIISSPSVRAHDTAKEIALATGYPLENIVLIDDIKERHFGELENTKLASDIGIIHGKDETYVEKFNDVETMVTLQDRAAKVLTMLKARPENSILIASHAAFGRALKRAIEGIPYTVSETAFTQIPNAEIIKLI